MTFMVLFTNTIVIWTKKKFLKRLWIKAAVASPNGKMHVKAMGEEVKILRTTSSPYSLRIVLALKLKGIEHDSIYEDLSNKSPLLLHYNPIHKKVPVLLHNGNPILESLVILEYIEETWKQNPILLPEDPHERAKARFWAKFGDDKMLPSIGNIFSKKGKDGEEAIGAALENLKYLEEEVRGKKFFGGETIGLVDLALSWLVYSVGIIEEVCGLKLIDAEHFPSLLQWIQDFADVPVIKESLPPRDHLITKFTAIHEANLAKYTPK